MAKRDSYLLRIKPEVLEALRGWADDEFRSLNGQIEFVLHRALEQAGRLPKSQAAAPSNAAPSNAAPSDPAQSNTVQSDTEKPRSVEESD